MRILLFLYIVILISRMPQKEADRPFGFGFSRSNFPSFGKYRGELKERIFVSLLCLIICWVIKHSDIWLAVPSLYPFGMMFGFQARNRQNAAASPRANETAVGEIDTKPPFESVKAAVNLFVEASPPKADRPVLKKSRTIEESVLGRETQLHWILKEIDKYKEHVKAAESTKAQALGELEKANNTLQELTHRLEAASESKQSSIEATEVSKTRLQQLENQPAWQEAVDSERDQYKAAANQLISTKQQLNSLKQDFDIALVAKQASFQRAAEAQHAAKLNRKKISQLSKDVEAMSHTLERVKLASPSH